jgi:leader peptidase (prepilin peptidase) / N-methyltransferase
MNAEPAVTTAPTPLWPRYAPATGAVALCVAGAVVARLGFSAWDLVAAATAALLVWLAAIDLQSRLIPNRLVLPAAAALIAIAAALDPLRGVEHTLAAVAAGGFLLLAAAVRPAALGMGDVKLALLLGALLGFAVLEALIVCFGLVALTGLALVVRGGRSALKQQLPLAPFLAAGAVAALLLPG